MSGRGIGISALLSIFALGCRSLPDPESAGAKLYDDRCASCHRAYQPDVMTFEMWKIVVARMQYVMSRNGLRPLTADETNVLLEYLQRHSG